MHHRERSRCSVAQYHKVQHRAALRWLSVLLVQLLCMCVPACSSRSLCCTVPGLMLACPAHAWPRSGEVETRPGVLRLMDEAREMGIKVAVCSAATKPSVVFTLGNLLGEARVKALDCFMAGGCRAGLHGPRAAGRHRSSMWHDVRVHA